MSDPVMALGGATFDGFCTVREAVPRAMIVLRGDLASEKLAAAVKSAVGVAMPEARGVVTAGEGGAAWMSPDELLLFCGYEGLGTALTALRDGLAGEPVLVADVSDMRSVFTIEGPLVREVMMKLTPADMRSASFAPGEWRRSRVGQVSAAFRLVDETTVELVCFRSVARYVFDLLCHATMPGSELGVI